MWLVAYARLNVDTYHVLHGYGELDHATSFMLNLRRLGLKVAHAIAKARPIVVATSMAKPASKLFHFSSYPTVISNGIDTDLFDGTDRQGGQYIDKHDRHTILMVGTLTQNKGQHLAIQAFREILKSKPNAQLLIVGEGSTKFELLSMIEHHGLHSSVHLLGLRQDIAALMAKADVLWQLSKTEAAPMVVAEAMSCGTPVVGFDVRGVNDLVIQDQTGLLVKYGDLTSLVCSTNRLLNDNDLWTRLSQESRKVAIQKYSQTEMINLYEELLES